MHPLVLDSWWCYAHLEPPCHSLHASSLACVEQLQHDFTRAQPWQPTGKALGCTMYISHTHSPNLTQLLTHPLTCSTHPPSICPNTHTCACLPPACPPPSPNQVRDSYLLALRGLLLSSGDRLSAPVVESVGTQLRDLARLAGESVNQSVRQAGRQAASQAGTLSAALGGDTLLWCHSQLKQQHHKELEVVIVAPREWFEQRRHTSGGQLVAAW
jgi:hypothetical protein